MSFQNWLSLANLRRKRSEHTVTIKPQGVSFVAGLQIVNDGYLNRKEGDYEIVLGLNLADQSGRNAGLILDMSAAMERETLDHQPVLTDRGNRSPLLQVGVPPIVTAVRHFGPAICRYDSDGNIQVMYGSLGELGDEFRDLGLHDENAIRQFRLEEFEHGQTTSLLPSIQAMVDILHSQEGVRYAWIGVVTTGDFDDWKALGEWADLLAQNIADGRAPETKVVLLVTRASKDHMHQLESLDNRRVEGVDVDVFDVVVAGDILMAAEMMFAEPLRTTSLPVATRGTLFAGTTVLREFNESNGGVPQVIKGVLPENLRNVKKLTLQIHDPAYASTTVITL